ncbi:MAG: DUF885 domain-containing protein [Planctomycetota bacterium]
MKTLAVAVIGLVAGFGFAQERDAALVQLLDETVEQALQRSPMWLGPALGDDRFNDRLFDASPLAYAAERNWQAVMLERVRGLDRSGFTEADSLDADLLELRLATALEGAAFRAEQMPVTSIGGPQYWLPQMGSFAQFTKPRHYADHLSRMRQIPGHLDDTMVQMRAGMAAGRVAPRAIMPKALSQARSLTAERYTDQPDTHPLMQPFNERDGEAFRDEGARVLVEEVLPAYERFAGFLEDEYIPACRATFGASEGVDGPAAYDFAVRQQTTLDVTADEVHEIGLREVDRIKAEMHEVIERSDWATEGFGSRARFASPEDRFKAFVEYLRTDERFYVETPEELLMLYRDFAKRIDPEMVKLFGKLPRMPYGVRPIPRFAAPSSPTAYYYRGSIEAGKPGYFMANTHALDQRPTFDVVPLTLHEANPGHHHQLALAQEIEGAHPIRKIASYTAFSEGWGLYAEKLGLEMGPDPDKGFYADPYDDFGRLNYEMWRALRLVVDTGLHAKGWSRERAIEYMLANSAATRLDTENEVDRYIGWPGQATAYKMGELFILRLRAEAEAALGDAFDIRAWHDELLKDGSVPLPVLEKKMDRWVAGQVSG